MRRRSVSWPLTLLAFAAVIGGWFLLRDEAADSDGDRLVRKESRIPLILRLDEAVQEEGFPPDSDFRVILTGPERSVDEPGLPFAMPLTGALRFGDLPVHPEATLVFGHAIERVVLEEAVGATIDFVVRAIPRSGDERGNEPRDQRPDAVEIFRAPLVCGEVGAAPAPLRHRVPLPAGLVGARVDLVFATECDRELARNAAVPVYLGPLLESQGREVPLDEVVSSVTVLVEDLLERYDAATAADPRWLPPAPGDTLETCFAEGRDGNGDPLPPIPNPTFGVTAGFDPDDRFYAPRGETRPALFFGDDATLVRYRVRVPREGALLAFAIGVDPRSHGVGSAEFLVTIDGETALRRELDPEVRPPDRGWHEHTVDLAAHAGGEIEIEFAGRTSVRDSRILPLDVKHRAGSSLHGTLTVHQVRGAFGRPRLIRREEVPHRAARAPDRPSVVFVQVETFRADAPSCYGGIEGITPALDRLAREGVRVEGCITVAPWTAPSVASVLTGLYPATHGVVSYPSSYLPESALTLAERAARAGIATIGLSTNDLVSGPKNFDQGFETFLLAPYANARPVVETFGAWLVDHADEQFFAYLHLVEPHHPWNAPGEDAMRYVSPRLRDRDAREAYDRLLRESVAAPDAAPDPDDLQLMRALYLGEVHYLDRQLGRLRELLVAAGLEGRVVLIVTGDHGEEFGEHGALGHGWTVHAPAVEVPLVAWGPGLIPAGRVLTGPVENVALHAGVLELLGVPYDPDCVRPPLRFDSARIAGPAYSTTSHGIRSAEITDDEELLIFYTPLHALRDERWTFLYSPGDPATDFPSSYHLYDRASDPGEQVDLAGTRPEEEKRLKELLRRLYHASTATRLGTRSERLDEETLDALRKLGYFGGVPGVDSAEAFEAGLED